MSTQVDNAFIKQFEAEVHEAYQRQGSKLRSTVRQKNNVKGESTTFQKVGKGTAGQKDRHGLVPVMNIDHTPVECTLGDYYAGDWVDKLDELKLNIDERGVVANAGAYALGRKTDDLILTALATATNSVAVGTTGMTLQKFLDAIEELGERDVPMDEGDLFLIVGFQEWNELMSLPTFASADYVNDKPFAAGRGLSSKIWNGVLVMRHSGITPDGSDQTTNFMYHRTALGHASGADVMTDITWHGDRAAHFINNMMSQGSVLIDDNGVQKIVCDRSP